MFLAARYNHVNAIGLLCDQKADINMGNSQGMTPLMMGIWILEYKLNELIFKFYIQRFIMVISKV